MTEYQEIRQHELRKLRMVMLNGELQTNVETLDVGTSARVYKGGYWGFSSVPQMDEKAKDAMLGSAQSNAKAMSAFGKKSNALLPSQIYVGKHPVKTGVALSNGEVSDRLKALHAACVAIPGVKGARFMLNQEFHHKEITNSLGSDVVNEIARAAMNIFLIGENDDGAPVEVGEPLSWRGNLADFDWRPEALKARLTNLAQHLQAKRKAVLARGGLHTVVMSPNLAGILAHEAMGHPCEADLVLGGAITGGLRYTAVASELVTMVDYAHHRDGQECLIPVYADDEGSPAHDAVLIDKGVLTTFMNSRETAHQMGDPTTGSARAYAPNDEPLVRMRNTGIEAGQSKLQDMISEVDEGYFLVSTANGQADSTTEFMFGITLGYEIRNGKLGNAIKDTTMSGSAIKVLQSVDAVSNEQVWVASGYCGKKQPMVVSMGGPAIRAKAQLGGA